MILIIFLVVGIFLSVLGAGGMIYAGEGEGEDILLMGIIIIVMAYLGLT